MQQCSCIIDLQDLAEQGMMVVPTMLNKKVAPKAETKVSHPELNADDSPATSLYIICQVTHRSLFFK